MENVLLVICLVSLERQSDVKIFTKTRRLQWTDNEDDGRRDQAVTSADKRRLLVIRQIMLCLP